MGWTFVHRCDGRGCRARGLEWTKVHWAGDIQPTRMKVSVERRWARGRAAVGRQMKRRHTMNNIFYIIGVVVVVAAVLGYLGLR
jgi:hypothetical protein